MAVGLIFIHIHFFLAEEPGGINYDWQLAGAPGGSEYYFWNFATPQVCTGALYCVLIARTQGPGQKRGWPGNLYRGLLRKPFFSNIEGGVQAGEERECQRTAEVTDPPLAAAAWES
jgi:hypothetical protein